MEEIEFVGYLPIPSDLYCFDKEYFINNFVQDNNLALFISGKKVVERSLYIDPMKLHIDENIACALLDAIMYVSTVAMRDRKNFYGNTPIDLIFGYLCRTENWDQKISVIIFE